MQVDDDLAAAALLGVPEACEPLACMLQAGKHRINAGHDAVRLDIFNARAELARGAKSRGCRESRLTYLVDPRF